MTKFYTKVFGGGWEVMKESIRTSRACVPVLEFLPTVSMDKSTACGRAVGLKCSSSTATVAARQENPSKTSSASSSFEWEHVEHRKIQQSPDTVYMSVLNLTPGVPYLGDSFNSWANPCAFIKIR